LPLGLKGRLKLWVAQQRERAIVELEISASGRRQISDFGVTRKRRERSCTFAVTRCVSLALR
ncbi:MAG: hypothetical protein WCA55_23265, partial [Xanthobacteraceae bacterium]